MTFISDGFIIFLFCILVGYFIVPIKYRWIELLVASLIFYSFSGADKLIFILVSALLIYYMALKIEKVYALQKEYFENNDIEKKLRQERILKDRKKCKKYVVVSVVVLLAILIYTKTGKWLLSSLDNMLSLNGKIDKVIVPLGISYYTFSLIGYLADVYWRKEKVEKNFFKFLLYVLYFPKILQGPIIKHRNIASQLIEGHTFDYKRCCFGIQLMLWGYFKKLVIADRLAILTHQVFTHYDYYGGALISLAVIASAVQLYCDFSGCMDIASGISEIMGITLEKNFNHPFFSKSAAEFWRRWHITLGQWFKDYVYMPLVVSPNLLKLVKTVKNKFGNQAGKNVMTIIPLLVVWILTGLWHGTGLDYILWGVYWGGIIIFSTIFEKKYKEWIKKWGIDVKSKSWEIFQMIRTFMIFCGGRLLTAPRDIRITGGLIKKMIIDIRPYEVFDGTLFSLGLNLSNVIVAIIGIAVLWKVSIFQENGKVRESIAQYNIIIRWIVYYVLIFSIIIFGIYGPGYATSSFAYMNF